MSLRITSNMPAVTVGRNLGAASQALQKSYEKLTSGQRIVHAGDDPAGSSSAETLKTEAASLGAAEANANTALSMIQVAEGGMNEISNLVLRLKELAILSASDTTGERERAFIHQESHLILQEIDRISNSTNYNQIPLLNGQSSSQFIGVQVGIHNSENDRITIDLSQMDMSTNTLGLEGLSLESQDSAFEALDNLEVATAMLHGGRIHLGVLQNNIQSAIRGIQSTQENLIEARSRIMDVDMAKETTELSRQTMLRNVGIAILTQANSAPSQALKLL